MKIVVDTPTLYSPEEGTSMNLNVIPSCTIVDGVVYRDYVDINSNDLLRMIENGGIPTTSQPAIGDALDVFEGCTEEILVLPIGDGLSGTYQTMEGAKNMVEDNSHIYVVDTKTLAGPHRYLAQKAMKLREDGMNAAEIVEALKESIASSVSFVIPADFGFLRRSGRLTPIAAKIGSLIKIVPVMTQTEDKRRITPFTIKRSKKKAVKAIVEYFESISVNQDYRITVTHGGAWEDLDWVLDCMKTSFPKSELESFLLPPSLITHGGPGCIVIQCVKK